MEVNSLLIDSRNVRPGACFIALKGTKTDGQEFIESAIEKGALAIVCENLPLTINKNITCSNMRFRAKAASIDLSHST
jgi:UDP-N-acetylmuramoyl-L-alanyl-D-glutamate--2,6-diaminopimelate ligase